MFAIYPQPIQAEIHDGHPPADSAGLKGGAHIAKLQAEPQNESASEGPDDDGLFVSLDSTPAENVRWMMLFQEF